MNVEDYKRLEAYYAAAKSLKSQIEHIEKLLHGVRYRTKDGCKSFRLFIQRADGNGHDQGCHTTIPEYVFRDAIVPALAESLKRLREDLKALPPVHCKEEKEHEKRKTTSKNISGMYRLTARETRMLTAKEKNYEQIHLPNRRA